MNNLNEDSPRIIQPKGLKIKLRPHQLTSIFAMNELEKQSAIVIDKPDVTSGLYNTIKYKITDMNEIIGSTFVIETNSAILADKVGSGKTYMIIGLILNRQVPDVHDRFILGTDHFSVKMMSIKESEPVNLIVVPHNLTNQWKDFMDKSKLEYLVLNTVADFDLFFDVDYVVSQQPVDNPLVLYNKLRKKITIKKTSGSKTNKKTNNKVDAVFERKMLSASKVRNALDKYKVFVLNINRYRFFKQIFRSVKWARVIIDEMDSANIPNVFDEFGNFNWFLTATPTSIFYKSCRRYVNKIFGYNRDLLQYFVIKNNDDFIDASIILPRPHVFMINTLLQRVVSAIHDLIPQDVLQMINSGNMKEAVVRLNCNMDTEENIVKVLTDKIEVELYNLKKELKYVKSLVPVDQDAHEKRIQKLESDIDRCKTRLNTVHERIDSIKDDCCLICADNYDMPTVMNCCKSVFCLKCLLSALQMNSKCPYCRHYVKNNKEYHVISKKTNLTKKKSGKKAILFSELDKADVLEHLLMYIAKNEETPRILIFSDYSQTFDKIVKNIAKADLQYALLSGIPAHITNVINEFYAGTTNILLLDSRHYGSGLNLQAADYLILYHRMTPELETQVIGRAHRFGRKTPLKIIYLVNSSESQVSVMSKNPFKLTETDELWMVTNPPDNNDAEDNTENDNENDNRKNKTKSIKKKVAKNLRKTVKAKKSKKIKKIIIDSSDDESIHNPDNESDPDEIPIPKITKKKSKNKKFIDV